MVESITVHGKPFVGFVEGWPAYEDMNLVVEDGFASVERSWRERLFTRPWHPWGRAKDVQLWKPDPSIYKYKPDGRIAIAQHVGPTGEIIIGHPSTLAVLRIEIERQRGNFA